MTHTITFEFRGISFVAECEGDSMRYNHLSIKPDGDDANFLYWFQHAPEWPEIDRIINQKWNEYHGCNSRK